MYMTNDQPTAPELTELTLTEPDRRELIGWAATCVRRLLPIFDRHRPDDDRLANALDAADRFREGKLTVGPMRKQAFACHAAARDCTDPAAAAVARACGQATAVAHMGGHAQNLPRYTKKALSGHVLAEELEYQQSHVPDRFRIYIYGE